MTKCKWYIYCSTWSWCEPDAPPAPQTFVVNLPLHDLSLLCIWFSICHCQKHVWCFKAHMRWYKNLPKNRILSVCTHLPKEKWKDMCHTSDCFGIVLVTQSINKGEVHFYNHYHIYIVYSQMKPTSKRLKYNVNTNSEKMYVDTSNRLSACLVCSKLSLNLYQNNLWNEKDIPALILMVTWFYFSKIFWLAECAFLMFLACIARGWILIYASYHNHCHCQRAVVGQYTQNKVPWVPSS